MPANKAFSIKIKFLQKPFRISAQQITCNEEYVIYKLKLNKCSYYFINYKNDWKIVANFQPCLKLRHLIINALKKAGYENSGIPEDKTNLIVIEGNKSLKPYRY